MTTSSATTSVKVFKHGFLVFLLILFAGTLALTVQMVRDNYPYPKYMGLMVTSALLFNHLAISYAKTVRIRNIMAIGALVWSLLTLIYCVYALSHQI